MPEKKAIVIRKGKGKGHDGHHGGAWKVAYADFVTAMMAFFLLMWLLNMTDQEKRIQLALYFKEFSIFEKGGNVLESGGGGSSIKEHIVSSPVASEASPPLEETAETPIDAMAAEKEGEGKEKIKEDLARVVEAKLGDLKDQILVEAFEDGVRVQLMDKQGAPIFAVGGKELTPNAKKALGVIAESIRDMPNKVAIEGHTDALSYAGDRYTNWELSTDRASEARKELETNGLNPDRLAKVAGFAASSPLIKDNPNDPRNRRISILIFDYKPTPSP